MNLGIAGFEYQDLYDFEKLNALALAFDRFVEEREADLFQRFDAYRTHRNLLSGPDESALLIAVGRHLGAFLSQLFGTDETPVKARVERDAEVARFKKEFVAKRVAKSPATTSSADFAAA